MLLSDQCSKDVVHRNGMETAQWIPCAVYIFTSHAQCWSEPTCNPLCPLILVMRRRVVVPRRLCTPLSLSCGCSSFSSATVLYGFSISHRLLLSMTSLPLPFSRRPYIKVHFTHKGMPFYLNFYLISHLTAPTYGRYNLSI